MSFLKKLFGPKKQVIPKNTTIRVGFPNEPLPKEFIDQLAKFLSDEKHVKRAAYYLMEVNGSVSYAVTFDTELEMSEFGAFVQRVGAKLTGVDLRWPLDFTPWNEQIVMALAEQDPTLIFYQN